MTWRESPISERWGDSIRAARLRFQKSIGLTPSERVLAALCDRSFLQLWTYPNLFRKPGKELTDLLVVFENDVLIFSDKSCAYPTSGDARLDWERWFRRAIADSAHQIRQAERWIRTQPNRVFLDNQATNQLPIALPSPSEMRIHRICIATGAGNWADAEPNQGALALRTDVVDDEIPLTIGSVSKAHGFLNVFDESTLWLVMTELDTARDFIAYLDAKEKLFAEGLFIGASSEADILAYYLWNGRTFPPKPRPYFFEAGLWPQVEGNPQFQEGRRLNQESYLWDRLIENVTRHYLDQALDFGNDLTIADYEVLVRLMARETRFFRRVLSRAILKRADLARKGYTATLLPSEHADVVYTLLIGPGASRNVYREYRQRRSEELFLRCHAAKAARPQARHIIGLGLDALGVEGSSEDFIYIDTSNWNDEDMDRANRMRHDLGSGPIKGDSQSVGSLIQFMAGGYRHG